MEYEEILDELQFAIRVLEMNTQFLILFSYKEEVLIDTPNLLSFPRS